MEGERLGVEDEACALKYTQNVLRNQQVRGSNPRVGCSKIKGLGDRAVTSFLLGNPFFAAFLPLWSRTPTIPFILAGVSHHDVFKWEMQPLG